MKYIVRPISDRTPFTGKHEPSPFTASWQNTLDVLDRELRHLAARDVVFEVDVTSEADIRLDGMLRSNARVATPAARLAFDSIHGPLTYATDRYRGRRRGGGDVRGWQVNLRAIALGLEALRKVDRYGITKRGEQYSGWKALPAGRAMPPSHMTHTEARALIESLSGEDTGLPGGHSEDRAFRMARAVAHPDRNGGDRTLWDQVEQAATVLGVQS